MGENFFINPKATSIHSIDGFYVTVATPRNTGLPYDLYFECAASERFKGYLPYFYVRKEDRLIPVSISDSPEVIDIGTEKGDFSDAIEWEKKNQDILIKHWNGRMSDAELLFEIKSRCRKKMDLHRHTTMSPVEDMNENRMSPEDLVKFAYENGYKAIAITDVGTVQAFPEAYYTWKKLWNAYQKECEKKGTEAKKEDFLKVIYGMEGHLLSDEGAISDVLIYAKNEVGIRNLYRMVTDSYLKYFDKMPLIPSSILDEYREGLLIIGYYDLMTENLQKIVDQIGDVSPLREGKYYPSYPNAEEKIRKICEDRAVVIFGNNFPSEIRQRLNIELDAICKNGYARIFLMWKELVEISSERGYPTAIRGCVGGSLVAYLCGITEINPLPIEFGGYNIPIETFLGLGLDREPDININFASSIQELVQEGVATLPGVGDICYGGTVGTYNEKAKKLCGIKRGDGCHPGGIIILPEGEEWESFTPLQHPLNSNKVSTHFEYHYLTDSLLKLDILGYSPLDVLHELQELTGVRVDAVSMRDKETLDMLCNSRAEEIKNLPEFGSEFAREIIRESKAKSYDDLIKVCGLLHGSNVWDAQRDLLMEDVISLKDCIATRDDIFLFLMEKGMERSDAFPIMDSVRRGKGITREQKEKMKQLGIADWYIDACGKIKYLFPKSHTVSYTLVVYRLAYYMVYYPDVYSEALVAAG